MYTKWLEREQGKKSQHDAFGMAKKQREYTIDPAENLHKVADASEEYLTELGHSVATCSRAFTVIIYG